MRLNSLFLLIFLMQTAFAVAENGAKKALVAGRMQQSIVGARVDVIVNTRYIDGRSSTFSTTLNENGGFWIEADVPEPQLVTLQIAEDRIVLFLEPGDTLFVDANAMNFPLVVTFEGRAKHNNRLLRQYLQENPTDFSEFSLLKYKFNQLWLNVPAEMDSKMQTLAPTDFKDFLDKRKLGGLGLLDDYVAKNPKTTRAMADFLSAEILYSWAYNLLFYGTVYKNWHKVQPEFFEFLWEVPADAPSIGSHTYRQFLMAFFNYLHQKEAPNEPFYVWQYLHATDRLGEKSLAFFRSEVIQNALNSNYVSEILPFYNEFLKSNPQHDYDQKVAEIYQTVSRSGPGVAAPEFSAIDRNGNVLSLAQLRGKVVLIDFWASWCQPCLKKMDELAPFYDDLDRAGVQIVYVSLDQDQLDWQRAVAERSIRGAHVLSKYPNSLRTISGDYGVEAIPTFFIVGKDGLFAEKPHSNKTEDLRERLLKLAAQNN